MNHVFMDVENVHLVDLSLIGAKAVSFTLMVGPQQTKLDSGLVEKLMEHSASVRLVKLKTKADNALDFALAYYLGRAALADDEPITGASSSHRLQIHISFSRTARRSVPALR